MVFVRHLSFITVKRTINSFIQSRRATYKTNHDNDNVKNYADDKVHRVESATCYAFTLNKNGLSFKDYFSCFKLKMDLMIWPKTFALTNDRLFV